MRHGGRRGRSVTGEEEEGEREERVGGVKGSERGRDDGEE